jgi:hypothetical protein
MKLFNSSCSPKRVALAAVLLLSLAGSRLTAAPLAPGGTLYPAPGEPDPTGGLIIAQNLAIPFASGLFSGTLTSTIFQNDPSNPFGAGALTFTYQIHNDEGSIDPIDRMTVASFLGFATDVSYKIPVGGTVPTYANRAATGDTIGFQFLGAPLGPSELLPGQTSALLVVQTDAIAYKNVNASLIDGATATAASFAPVDPVPEPSLVAFFGLALAGLAVARRR